MKLLVLLIAASSFLDLKITVWKKKELLTLMAKHISFSPGVLYQKLSKSAENYLKNAAMAKEHAI